MPTPKKPNKTPLEAFVARHPEHLRPFYAAILRELPKGYALSAKGIVYRAHAGSQSPPFCSPFRVKALVKGRNSAKWSRLVELVDPIGDLVECTIPSGKLDGNPRDAIAMLSDSGLMLFDDHRIKTILNLIRNWPVSRDAFQILTKSVGWMPELDAFVLTSGQVIARSEAASLYRLEGAPDGKEVGNIATWRDGVAALAVGNTNLVFAIALALSTPLLAFTDLNSVIFHLFGRTSTGKTRVLKAALTVWPKIGVKEKTWDATINGLEGELSRSSHILLGLDELPKDASADLGNMIYKVSLGSGKARSEKDGSAKKRTDWQTAVISTGEHSVLDTLKRIGKTPTGGQGVRMIDIPADGEYGLFDNLHDHMTSDAFVRMLDRSIRDVSGPAGATFVRHLMAVKTDDLKARLEAEISKQSEALQDHLGIVSGDDSTNEVRRVLDSFALIAIAGEWATESGLTGWAPGMASDAVRTIAQRWLTGRGTMPLDQSEGIKIIRDYIAEHDLRFMPLSDAGAISQGDEWPPGFQDEDYYYVLPSTMSKVYEEKSKLPDYRSYLLDAGFLKPGTEKGSWQFKMGWIGARRPRSYRICKTILEFQESREAG